MKASELQRLFDTFYDTEVCSTMIFGCDCGCGGDLYTLEEWGSMHEDSYKATKGLKEALASLNVEWDFD